MRKLFETFSSSSSSVETNLYEISFEIFQNFQTFSMKREEWNESFETPLRFDSYFTRNITKALMLSPFSGVKFGREKNKGRRGGEKRMYEWTKTSSQQFSKMSNLFFINPSEIWISIKRKGEDERIYINSKRFFSQERNNFPEYREREAERSKRSRVTRIIVGWARVIILFW